MIDLIKAKHAFKEYVSAYDPNIPLIKLKIVHTYKVVDITKELCKWLGLNEKDIALALLIALLHDIGRFEQYRIYQCFEDYKTIDHALLGSQILFDNQLIRKFIKDDSYDEIIKISIEQHNKYKIDDIKDERLLLFVHLIRDADKLDNFRVKEEETIETLFKINLDMLEHELISDEVYHQFMNSQLIYGPTRKSHLDMWISYIAFIFDLHFKESMMYIYHNNWVDRSFGRVKPIESQKYNELYHHTKEYVRKIVNEENH